MFRCAWTSLGGSSSTLTFDFLLFFIVDVLLKAVGDTPIMKTKKWAVDRGRTVQSLAQFISRFLKLDASEQLVRMKFVHWLVHFTKSCLGQRLRKHASGLLILYI